MILEGMEILLIVVAVQVFNMLVFVWSRRWVTRVSSLCRGYQRNNWAISGVSSHWKDVEFAHVAATREPVFQIHYCPTHFQGSICLEFGHGLVTEGAQTQKRAEHEPDPFHID